MFNLIEKELKEQDNYSLTENEAVGFKSTGSALVDLNFKVSSLRNKNEDEIIGLFDAAFHENPKYAVKWLFFVRDIREGLGERRLFRICYRRLCELNVELFYHNISNIQEYGRWEDIIYLIGISDVTDNFIIKIIKSQLKCDLHRMKKNKNISLLGKWLPSENASSKTTKEMARNVRKLLGLSSRKYRVMLSELRSYLDIVEVKMCNNNWEDIDYNKVPSLANLKYKNAFMKHDEIRRIEYLESVKKGTSKLNMKIATPVDIVSKYNNRWEDIKDYDETLELAWNNLKDVMIDDTVVVADGSGSMFTYITNTIKAIDVANALAIYTSEHNSGVYKNKYITFSNKPQFVEFSEDDSLRNKLEITREYNEMSNTNIEAVFKLILEIAVKYNISDEDMVKNVLIISDMEFDAAQKTRRNNFNVLTKSLFDEINDYYNGFGYKLPRLIFWNVDSRTGTIPIQENKLGVALVSGFSQNVLKMVMSNKLNPYEVLIEILDSERYDKVII